MEELVGSGIENLFRAIRDDQYAGFVDEAHMMQLVTRRGEGTGTVWVRVLPSIVVET